MYIQNRFRGNTNYKNLNLVPAAVDITDGFKQFNIAAVEDWGWSSLNDFSDDRFKNYYSDHEQRLNFQSYLDSVELTCPGLYIPFYFSKESVETISLTNIGGGYMVEFIAENNVVISNNDTHMNELGHNLWAEKMKNIIK